MQGSFSPNALKSNERTSVLCNVKWTKRELVFCAIGIVALLMLIVAIILLALGVGHGLDIFNTKTNVIKVVPPSCLEAGCLESSATLIYLRNTSVDPCDNFYAYACSSQVWSSDRLKDNEREFSVLHELREENEKRLENVLLTFPERTVAWSSEMKIKNFYASCVDTYGNSVNGGKNFLASVVDKAGGWVQIGTMDESTYSFTEAMKKVHIDFWKDALFRVHVGTDWVTPSKNAIEIGLGGLTLRWWDYIDTTDKHIKLFEGTKTFMKTISKLVMRDSGTSMTDDEMNTKADEFAQDVFDFEFKVANTTWYTLPSNNPHDHQNRVSVSELNALSDQFDWVDILTTMFRDAGVTRDTKVVLLEREFLGKLNDVVKNYPNQIRVMNNYFTWRLMLGYVTDLGWEYIHANRVFYVARTGVPEFTGVPKYCFNRVQYHFSDALGALYIRDHLHTNDKTTVDNLVKYLKQGLQDRLGDIDWMEDSSQKVAVEKVKLIVDKVGYPSWMTDDDYIDDKYSSLNITKGNYLNNLIETGKFEMKKTNDRLTKGQDKSVWRLMVWDTAGGYDMFWNELLIAAGMLQWPLYAKSFPKYYNFGSLGVPLAHELTHAVDEIGGYYLPNGTYFDWWTKNTTLMYNKRRACLEDLDIRAGPYRLTADSPAQYVKIEGTYVARELTAEMAALRMVYYAYKDWVKDNAAEKLAPGVELTNEQTMFLAYAQTQCFVRRDEYSISKAERHILPEDVRLNQALAHTPEFVNAFQCKEHSKMRAEKPCEVF